MLDNTLQQYYKDLGNLNPLSRAEEVELTRQSRQGNREAREKLILANLRFVIRVAQEYQNRGLPLADLISVGNIGLVAAVERFDETRGFKFISYAVWWIRQAIQHSLAQDVRTIRLPVNREALLSRINKICNTQQQAGQDRPELEVLSETLGVSKEMIRETQVQAQNIRSLDATYHDSNTNALIQFLPDPNQKRHDEEIANDSVCAQIQKVLGTIDKREAEVIRLYFGFNDKDPMTLEEIGKLFNLTRERIRQIKEKALCKLRHPNRRAQLKDLIESV